MTQEHALDILKMGHNVYLTGPAGSGKTYVLNKYIEYLKNKGVDVGITASTGIAATHLGGVTIHSWTGMGVKSHLTEYDLEALEEKQYLWKRFEKVKVLIIDEVSMLHHFRLDLVDKICKGFKRNAKPFGGIQIVLCGDFFQLPPVSASFEDAGQFVYHAASWKNGGFKICYLEEQHRQTDNETVSILNEIRGNKVTQKSHDLLKSKMAKSEESEFSPTRLYTHNIDVDKINNAELAKIKSEEKTFEMMTRGGDLLVDLLKKSCLAVQQIKLKVGAKVMFIKNNFEEGYVNGTLGTVTAIGKGGPVVRTYKGKVIDVEPASWKIEEDGKVKAEIIQYPLRLAWAITVHKSQGMSLDAVEVDLSKSFERGMGYVALSRIRSLDGLKIIGLNDTALKVSEEVLEYDEELRDLSKEAAAELLSMDNVEIKQKQAEFLKRIGALDTNPDSNKKIEKPKKLGTIELTKSLILEGKLLDEISRIRNLKADTILDHAEKLLSDDPLFDFSGLYKSVSTKKQERILGAFKKAHKDLKVPIEKLTLAPVKHLLDSSFSYIEIRLIRMLLIQDML